MRSRLRDLSKTPHLYVRLDFTLHLETFDNRLILFKIKESENINRRNTL